MMATPTIQELPSELRTMIWEYVMLEQRVITIDHTTAPQPDENLRCHIQETIPLTLHICHESRLLALRKYGSVFLPATVWSYIGSRKHAELKRICQSFGLTKKGTEEKMVERISAFVNDGQDRVGQVCKDFDPTSYGLLHQPRWYDPNSDILCLKLCLGHRGLQKTLWHPRRHFPETSKIRKLAFVLETYGGNNGSELIEYRRWIHLGEAPEKNPMHPSNWELPALETVTFLLRSSHEVITIMVDTRAPFKKAHDFAYSLDEQSEDFRNEIGTSWSGVMWRVVIGGSKGRNTWQSIIEWNPRRAWCYQKRRLRKGNNDVLYAWLPTPELVEIDGTKMYLETAES